MRRALLSALLGAAPAGPVYEPLASGQTKILFDKSFLRVLKSEGVSLAARPPAKLGGNAVTFPIVGGKLDPTSANGTLEHGGALLFKVGKKSVPLKALQLKTTQKRAPLSAEVGGSQFEAGKRERAGGLARGLPRADRRLRAHPLG